MKIANLLLNAAVLAGMTAPGLAAARSPCKPGPGSGSASSQGTTSRGGAITSSSWTTTTTPSTSVSTSSTPTTTSLDTHHIPTPGIEQPTHTFTRPISAPSSGTPVPIHNFATHSDHGKQTAQINHQT